MYQQYIFVLIFLVKNVFGESVPIVSTTQGPVRGLLAENGNYYMYLGIPYGLVDPNNPFGVASPHPAFDGTFDAFDDSAICPQKEEFNQTIVGSLDCLHLNVFVPKSNTNTPKAVLVWIFGGGFQIGFYGRYVHGPKFIVRHDIILITVNYRIGPYGFMCTDDALVPGNQGLKDQLMALKWINENIANFGGDPNKITIDGNSAGAMAADLHIVRNYQPRLFNQAILQSGTSMNSFGFPDTKIPLKLSQHFGFNTDDIPRAVEFLASIDPLDVIDASIKLGFSYAPCIEQTFEGVEAFISHNWVRNDTLPFAKDMNVMIGFNDDEGVAFTLGLNLSQGDIVGSSLAGTFDINHDEFDKESVRHFFFGDEEFNNDVRQDVYDLRSDMLFVYPSMRSLARLLKNEVQKVYFYIFSYDGGRNFVKYRNNITEGGATHADEMGYLFDISFMVEPNVLDQMVVDRITEMWANFVKYGDPTPQITSMLPQKWDAITSSSPQHYMDIGLELTPGTRPWQERMTFWDLFFETYGHLQHYMLLEDGQRLGNKIERIWSELMPF